MIEITEQNKQNYSRMISYGERIQFIADNDTLYEFWDLIWYNYPIFSHREEREKGYVFTDSRNFNLPTQIEKELFDEYGGYYMADGKVEITEIDKKNYTKVKPDVGNIYPLREP